MNKKEEKMLKISFVLNIIIFCLVIIASIIMFTGFKFMKGPDVILNSNDIRMLRFFTVDSNIFMGIIALVFAIEEYKLLNGKIKEIPNKLYIFKLMATTSVGLTFFVVFTYLGQIAEHGITSLLMNSNLFFHLIIPVLSMINFTIFEKTSKLKLLQVTLGIIPTLAYATFYLINVFIHMENGKVSPIYDWYWFVQHGVWTAGIVVPLIFGISYLISLILWTINKKKEEGD